MRDPNRIKDILNRLANAWRQKPDLRLGQLILSSLPEGQTDAFFIEDEDLILRIEERAFESLSVARRINIQRKPIVE